MPWPSRGTLISTAMRPPAPLPRAARASTKRDKAAGVRFLDRVDERLLVERQRRARVDHLDGDALLLGVGCGAERLVHKPAGRDHGYVLALAVHARLAERDRLELVRYVLLDPVERSVLEEGNGIAVVDRRPEEPANVGRRRG